MAKNPNRMGRASRSPGNPNRATPPGAADHSQGESTMAAPGANRNRGQAAGFGALKPPGERQASDFGTLTAPGKPKE
jgi:hypothetical protein